MAMKAPKTPSTCAVIVTFERPRLLTRCLEAVAAQSSPPETILVVDNASRDRTRELLSSESRSRRGLSVLSMRENLGPAGGFAAGLERALDGDAELFWLMDDDVLPAEDCLERLVSCARTHHAQMVFPSIFDENRRPADYPGWSGVLLAREAVRRGGVPRSDLFWWIEDTEYLQWRLPRLHGVPSCRCPTARVEHGLPSRHGPKPAWKYYYEVRNTLHYRLRIQDTSWRRRGARMLVVTLRSSARALLEPGRLSKLRMVLRGVRDGLTGRLGKRVDPTRIR